MKDSKNKKEWKADGLISRYSRILGRHDIKENIKSQKNRFTLIEILVVCILLAFLMAISFGGFSIAMNNSAKNATVSIIKQMEAALEAYKAKYGYYITTRGGGDLINGENLIVKYNNKMTGKMTEDTALIKLIPNYNKWLKNSILHDIPRSGSDVSRPILERMLCDAYGNPFWFRSPGYHNRNSFDLESAGADGLFGYADGDDKHATVTNEDEAGDNINNWSN